MKRHDPDGACAGGAIVYTLKCLDRRYFLPNDTDESDEIEIIGRRPKTGICERCKRRVPLPDPLEET